MPSAIALAAVPGLPATSRRESDDDYFAVIARLNARWRVIPCRDGVQWILQYRAGQRHGTARFDNRSYLRTRDALIHLCRALAAPVDPFAHAILESLPHRI